MNSFAAGHSDISALKHPSVSLFVELFDQMQTKLKHHATWISLRAAVCVFKSCSHISCLLLLVSEV